MAKGGSMKKPANKTAAKSKKKQDKKKPSKTLNAGKNRIVKKKEIKKKLKTAKKKSVTKKIRIKSEKKPAKRKIKEKVLKTEKKVIPLKRKTSEKAPPKPAKKIKAIPKVKREKKPEKIVPKIKEKISVKKEVKKVGIPVKVKPEKLKREVKVKPEKVKKEPILVKPTITVEPVIEKPEKYITGAEIKAILPPSFWEKLPTEYGENYITAITVDPYQIFVFWEVREDSLKIFKGNLGIRVYDVTDIDFETTEANSYFDIQVSERIGSTYINVSPSKDFIADIGVFYEGIFLTFARSKRVSTPRFGIFVEGLLTGEMYESGFNIGY